MVPQLVIEAAGDRGRSLADISTGGVELWTATDGVAVAYSATVGRQHWIDILGVGRFRFQPGDDIVTAYPDRLAARDVVQDAYQRAVLPMLLQAGGKEVLHASAVLTATGVVAFCGQSATGKSTLAAAFSRRGYGLWADDTVVCDASETSVMALPVPFRVRLRPAAAAFFGGGVAAASTSEGNASPGSRSQVPVRLVAVCVLERVEDVVDGVAVEPLTPSSAFRAMLPHAFCFNLDDERSRQRMTQNYLRLVKRVGCFAVRFQPGFERLPVILDAIERVALAPLPERPIGPT